MRNSNPTGRRERKREATRTNIINASAALFDEYGFDSVTIDDITERADVAKGTFYLHFRTKEEVAIEVYNSFIGEAVARVLIEASERSSARQLLLSFFEAAAGPAVEKRRLAQVALSSAMSQAYAEPEEDEDLFSKTLMTIAGRGQQSGELRLDWTVTELALLIGALFGTTVWSWVALPQNETLPARLIRCVDTIFDGMSAK